MQGCVSCSVSQSDIRCPSSLLARFTPRNQQAKDVHRTLLWSTQVQTSSILSEKNQHLCEMFSHVSVSELCSLCKHSEETTRKGKNDWFLLFYRRPNLKLGVSVSVTTFVVSAGQVQIYSTAQWSRCPWKSSVFLSSAISFANHPVRQPDIDSQTRWNAAEKKALLCLQRGWPRQPGLCYFSVCMLDHIYSFIEIVQNKTIKSKRKKMPCVKVVVYVRAGDESHTILLVLSVSSFSNERWERLL